MRAVLSCLPLVASCSCLLLHPPLQYVLPTWHGPMQPQHLNLEIRDVTMYCPEVPPEKGFFHLIFLFSSTSVSRTVYFRRYALCITHVVASFPTIYSSKEGRGAIDSWLVWQEGQERTGLLLFSFVLLGGAFGHLSIDQPINRSLNHPSLSRKMMHCTRRKDNLLLSHT